MKTAFCRLFLSLFLLVSSACSTTQVQESWRLPGYQPPQPQKILVVALAAKDSTRRLVESRFVDALEARGLLAVPSHQWITDGTAITRRALEPLVAQNGVTTVLISSVRDVQKTTAYQPATTAESDGLFRTIDTYYAYSSTGQHEGGTYAQITDYLIETNLFDTRNGKLSWSVITRTRAPKTLKDGIQDVTDAVMKKAGQDGAL